LEQLRADVRTKTIPVILPSARAGEEAYIGGMNAGGDDYIVKPFGARELLARVKARLEIARVRRETERRITNILDSITDGFQVIDPAWRLIYMNSEAKRTLAEHGIDPEAALGKDFWNEIFPDAVNTEIAAQLRRAMSERVPSPSRVTIFLGGNGIRCAFTRCRKGAWPTIFRMLLPRSKHGKSCGRARSASARWRTARRS
jgi:response regulator RpfG family c-di-GMP phosphodiesterase